MKICKIVDVANASSANRCFLSGYSCRENHRTLQPDAWCVIDTAGTQRLIATDSFSEADVVEEALIYHVIKTFKMNASNIVDVQTERFSAASCKF